MKRRLQSVLSCILMLLFLAGSTGVTLFIHTCSGSNTTEVTAYPEFRNHTANCGCDEEATPGTTSSGQTAFENPECCRTQHLLLKMPFLSYPASWHQLVKIDPAPLFLTDLLLLPFPEKHIRLSGYLPWHDHSPPSGKALVYLIHQIRIPFPVC